MRLKCVVGIDAGSAIGDRLSVSFRQVCASWVGVINPDRR
jgi:hypothetical protein